MNLSDFVVYCGRVFIATAKRVDGSVDIEDLKGTTTINLKEKDIKELTKTNCWYKKR